LEKISNNFLSGIFALITYGCIHKSGQEKSNGNGIIEQSTKKCHKMGHTLQKK